MIYSPPSKITSMNIGKSKVELRKLHWQEIKARVKTHEGESLFGNKGRQYQQKWSKKYLGRDLSKPVNFDKTEYQKELSRTK